MTELTGNLLGPKMTANFALNTQFSFDKLLYFKNQVQKKKSGSLQHSLHMAKFTFLK